MNFSSHHTIPLILGFPRSSGPQEEDLIALPQNHYLFLQIRLVFGTRVTWDDDHYINKMLTKVRSAKLILC